MYLFQRLLGTRDAYSLLPSSRVSLSTAVAAVEWTLGMRVSVKPLTDYIYGGRNSMSG